MSEAREEIRAAIERAALLVDCPKCARPVGDVCRTLIGAYPCFPHVRRIDAAREAGHWSISESAR